MRSPLHHPPLTPLLTPPLKPLITPSLTPLITPPLRTTRAPKAPPHYGILVQDLTPHSPSERHVAVLWTSAPPLHGGAAGLRTLYIPEYKVIDYFLLFHLCPFYFPTSSLAFLHSNLAPSLFSSLPSTHPHNLLTPPSNSYLDPILSSSSSLTTHVHVHAHGCSRSKRIEWDNRDEELYRRIQDETRVNW